MAPAEAGTRWILHQVPHAGRKQSVGYARSATTSGAVASDCERRGGVRVSPTYAATPDPRPANPYCSEGQLLTWP
jgi:hypothetical protein